MDILQLLGCGFLTLVVYLVLNEYKSSAAIFVVTAFGVLVLMQSAGQLHTIINTLLELCVQAGVHTAYALDSEHPPNPVRSPMVLVPY